MDRSYSSGNDLWHIGVRSSRGSYRPQARLHSVSGRRHDQVFVYSRITEAAVVLWAGAIMGLFVNGTNGAIFALVSEAYPTVARATAQNVLWNLARAVGALGPLAVGAITAKYPFQIAIGLLAFIYILDILATLFLVPELKGKELE